MYFTLIVHNSLNLVQPTSVLSLVRQPEVTLPSVSTMEMLETVRLAHISIRAPFFFGTISNHLSKSNGF